MNPVIFPEKKKSSFIFSIYLSLVIPIIFLHCRQNTTVIEGEVDAAEVDVGVKIPGRLERIDVHEGDHVEKGQALGNLESRAVSAKMDMANAAISEARSQFQYASNTYMRMKRLHAEGAIPRQKFDEVTYKYQAAKQKLEAMSGQQKEVRSYLDESTLRAPIDGEVSNIVVNEGEIVSPGYPVITILDSRNQWVVFQIREDRLRSLQKGQEVMVSFPALNQTHNFQITHIAAMGKFAKWKSTNDTGSFDMKSFEVHCRPVDGPLEQLRPGMTALMTLHDAE